MDMNKAFHFKPGSKQPKWRLIDADGKILGRLATTIAQALRGKDKPEFTKNADAGDYIIVINAEKIKLTGDKWRDKKYQTYSGWIGNRKEKSAEEMLERKPEFLLMHAVKNMLPKNTLSRQQFKKLKVYAGSEHPHQAQVQTQK
jgi:large subunit ribosomal protein L13